MALFGLFGAKKKKKGDKPEKSAKQRAAEARAARRAQAMRTGFVEHPEIQKEFRRQRFMVENENKIRAAFYLGIAAIVLIILSVVAIVIINNVPGRDDDKDGVPNVEDVCPGFDDTEDDDKDGVPNGCEERPPTTDLNILESTIVTTGTDRYDVAVEVNNPNLEWGASPLEYSIALIDAEGNLINSVLETDQFILPGQTKMLMAFNILAVQQPAKAELTITYAEWIKVQNYQEPDFTTETVSYQEVEEPGVFARLKGKVTNNTTFTLNNVEIGIQISSADGTAIGLNKSGVETLTPGEGRDFIVTFPQELVGVTSGGISYSTDVDLFKTDTFVATQVVHGQRFQQFTPVLQE